MTGELIKSFFVGLGFDVDDKSLSQFNKAIADATLKVTALYASIKVMAAGIFYSIAKISDSFEQMGYEYRLIAPAINKALVLRQEMLKAYSQAGVNITKVIQQSVRFNMSLAKTQFAFKALATSVAARFFPMLTKNMDVFRAKLYQNMPRIQQALERFINFIFKAFDATVILGNRVWSILSRVYDFFVTLHQATDGWSTVILGVVAAWKLLNLSFLATPLGMLITGLVTLLALWDDFKTFREGGQSLINWGSDMTKTIVGLVAAIGTVAGVIYAARTAMTIWAGVTKTLSTITAAFNGVLTVTELLSAAIAAPIWAIVAAIGALIAALTLADSKWNIFGGKLSGFFSGVGSKIMDFAAGDPLKGLSSAVLGPAQGSPSPLGVDGAAASQSNQNVSQQTQINVSGSSDANAVGRAVAGEQNRVNFDFVRNLKGATR